MEQSATRQQQHWSHPDGRSQHGFPLRSGASSSKSSVYARDRKAHTFYQVRYLGKKLTAARVATKVHRTNLEARDIMLEQSHSAFTPGFYCMERADQAASGKCIADRRTDHGIRHPFPSTEDGSMQLCRSTVHMECQEDRAKETGGASIFRFQEAAAERR
jgi:hypothetical protein